MRAMIRTYRTLLKRPALLLAVILTLTLGIGGNSAIFSVIDAVLLKPLPYPDGDRLMALFESNPRKKAPRGQVAPVRVEEWNRMNSSFSGITGAYTENVAETSGELPEMLMCARVSPRFFAVLETLPLIGRVFSPEEDLMTGPRAAILSESLWRRRFGSDPQVLGKQLKVGQVGYPIIGVMPATVTFPDPHVDFWIPAKLPAVVMRSREARFHTAIGRLKAGVTRQSAQADLAAVQGRLALQFPATDRDWTALVEPLKDQSIAGVRKSLWVLFGAVSLVLLIACANVACLLLAQATQREREIAVRFSLGARRGQVVRELLAESFCLALPGVLLGLAAAILAASALRRAAALLPRAAEIHLDWRIVAFTLALSVLTTLLFGLVPALRATRGEIAGVLSHGSRTQIGGRHAIERLLVSGQIALAIVLLVGSGLLIRSLARLSQVSLGFDPGHVLAYHVSASWGEKNDMQQVAQRLARTLEATRSIPGVEATALTISAPGEADDFQVQFHIAGRDTGSEGEKLFADSESVSPGYFQVLGMPLLSGRTCQVSFDPKAPQYVLVSDSFARKFFPDRNPIGEYLTAVDAGPGRMEIIGVTSDVRKHGYAKDPAPIIYWCGIPRYYPGPTFLAKTSGDPMRLAETVRQKIRAIEPNRAVFAVTRLSDYLDSSLAPRRFQMLLLTGFAATALLLAAIGLYGVTTFLVSQRTREIGLRVALGAQRSQIFAQVFRQGAWMTGIGILAGIMAAAAASKWIASLLFGVAPTDPGTFVAVPALLAVIAAVAIWSPASRATRVDPLEALRQE